jgi:hypothetical protein
MVGSITMTAEKHERVCVECGTTFLVGYFDNRRVVCSPDCALKRRRATARKYQRANYVPRANTLPRIACAWCGDEFQPSRAWQKPSNSRISPTVAGAAL